MSFLSLIARLSLNASGFEQGLKRAESQASKFGGDLKKKFVQAFGVASMTATFLQLNRSLIAHAEEVHETAQKYNLSAIEAQQWQRVAKHLGLTLGELRDHLDATGKKISELEGFREAVTFDSKDIENVRAYARELEDLSLKAQGALGFLLLGGRKIRQRLDTPFEEYFRIMRERKEESNRPVLDVPKLKKLDARIAELRFELLPDEEKLKEFENRLEGFRQKQREAMRQSTPESVLRFKEAEIGELETSKEIEKFKSRVKSPTSESSRVSSGTDRMNVNQLQTIGAFVGTNPLTVEIKSMSAKLDRLHNDLEAIKRHVDPHNVARSGW